MKNLSNIHTHTHWCDGQGSVQELCQAAWEKGFVSIGISGHGPVPFKNDCNMRQEDLASFRQEVAEAKEFWRGKLEVYIGLEVDFVQGLCGPADGRLRRSDWDFLIGSVHWLLPPEGAPGGAPPFAIDGAVPNLKEAIQHYYQGDGKALCIDYWRAVQNMVLAGGFDMVAHLDLIKRHNEALMFFNADEPWYQRAALQCIELIGQKDLICEINTGGFTRGHCRELFPSPALIQHLKVHNVRISINSDAHAPSQLDGHYRQTRTYLLEHGWQAQYILQADAGGQPAWLSTPLGY